MRGIMIFIIGTSVGTFIGFIFSALLQANKIKYGGLILRKQSLTTREKIELIDEYLSHENVNKQWVEMIFEYKQLLLEEKGNNTLNGKKWGGGRQFAC